MLAFLTLWKGGKFPSFPSPRPTASDRFSEVIKSLFGFIVPCHSLSAQLPFLLSPAMGFLHQQQTQSHGDFKPGIVGLRQGSTRGTRKRKFGFKGRGMMIFAPLSPQVLCAQAGSRLQSDPTPAAKAAAPSPPSWVGVNSPGRWVWRPAPKGRWHLWHLYLLLVLSTGNCAGRDRWDHGRKMGMEQKAGITEGRREQSRKVGRQQRVGMCQQGDTAPCASPQIPSLPQMQTAGSVPGVSSLGCNPVTEGRTGSSPFTAPLVIKTSSKPLQTRCLASWGRSQATGLLLMCCIQSSLGTSVTSNPGQMFPHGRASHAVSWGN